MGNPLFELVKDTVNNTYSFKVDKFKRMIDIKNNDGAVTTISFGYNTNDNYLLRVAAHGFEYQINGVKNLKKMEKIDCSGEKGNTFWLLNKYHFDFNITISELNVFLQWKREEIIDFLSNHYILLNA